MHSGLKTNFFELCDDLWLWYCECTFCWFELFFYAGCNSVLVTARTCFQKRFFFFLLPQCDFSWLNNGWIKINYPDKKRPLWNIYCAQLHTNKSWFFLDIEKGLKLRVWWVSDSTEKIYIHPGWAKKSLTLFKESCYRTTAKRNNMQSTTACHSSNARAPRFREIWFHVRNKTLLVCVAGRKSRQREARRCVFIWCTEDPES